ncbi:hypothetical protein JOF56_009512 [Kibdelosporangium banguiense]|uniref:Type VII secretion system-associated protein n=1 Tax=Kibdelosporangium banguiense TaxID=1365924 RepID=A0ABS4TXJ3_9PSEU|nr:type VII secretion system-associated protein [Kibdelosporangium banguiense]MBP2329127.1 hypothetical protein [Kibdelosporangium banguiense]
MVDQQPAPEDTADWAVLLDPGWQPSTEDEVPPVQAIVGGWSLDEEGNPGRFEPNPQYVPSDASSPTDLADAVMHMIIAGEADVAVLIDVLGESTMEIAVDEEGYPLVGPAPDDVPCVAVITSEPHRERVGAEHWATVTIEELVEGLPPDTDILLNPGSPASTRIVAHTLRESIAGNS